MKLFETALENFAFLGTEWDESSQKYLYSLRKKLVAVCVGLLCFILTFIFLIKDAKTFDEYTEALFICSTAFMCTVITAEIFLKLGTFSEFTRTCKIAIDNSKWTYLFHRISISLHSNLAQIALNFVAIAISFQFLLILFSFQEWNVQKQK